MFFGVLRLHIILISKQMKKVVPLSVDVLRSVDFHNQTFKNISNMEVTRCINDKVTDDANDIK